MLNRLTKSAELQTRVDEEYFKINMEGHQMRLKLENTLKNCYQVPRKILQNSFRLLSVLLKDASLTTTSWTSKRLVAENVVGK